MPQSFLSLLATDLLSRYGHNMHRVTIVFPNKRAGIFLNHALAKLSPTPVWTPQYATMGDLFQALSPLSRAEQIDAVCTLYHIYAQEIQSQDESLDQFYNWGEQLLADFDDIDKHLAPARAIFANVHDLQQLSDLTYLTPEQEKALTHFFEHFDIHNQSKLRNNFLQLWSKMHTIYTKFNTALASRGLAYEGAMYRQVVEQLKDNAQQSAMLDKLPQAIIFAGFNVLNDVEEKLMQWLKKEGRAQFYWDYDTYYTQQPDNEAGHFMRRNLAQFGSALPEKHYNNLSQLRDITLIATNTDNAQAHTTTTWLQGTLNPNLWQNAIVLCDESLLLPVLHSIPSENEPGHPESMNATMGFPLRDTPIYSYITTLATLQTEGYDNNRRQFRHSALQAARKHIYYPHCGQPMVEQYAAATSNQLLTYLIAVTETVGKAHAQKSQNQKDNLYQQLYTESIYQVHRTLQQLLQLTSRTQAPLHIEPNTLRRLLRQILATINIPFHGEPAVGIQVMGVLETRCLDFTHLLILSLEEGKLPKKNNNTSFIPGTLREAFGLTTDKHKIAIYSYYFYRLIQRTQHLTCVYNETSNDITHHEISRFLRQLQAETNLPIQNIRQTNTPHTQTTQAHSVQKTDEMCQQLLNKYALNHQSEGKQPRPLSPSALNTYIDCPMQFYYRYVEGLREPNNPDAPEMLPLLGTIFHDTIELVYTQLTNRYHTQTITKEILAPIAAQPELHIEPFLDILFEVHLFHPIADDKKRAEHIKTLAQNTTRLHPNYSGAQIIHKKVLLTYLTHLINYDVQHTPFTLVGMETDRTINIPVGSHTLHIGGRVDRIDLMDGTLRIVDYKTGGKGQDSCKNIESLFTPSAKRNKYYFQIMLYALAQLHSQPQHTPITPTLFYPGKAFNSQNYNPTIILDKKPIQDFTPLAEEFHQHLQTLLAEILNPEIPFTQTTDKNTCQYCPYKTLCK